MKYIEDVCPVCEHDNSVDFEYDIPNVVMSEYVNQTVECTICGSKWVQMYDIVYKGSQIKGEN